MSKDKKQQTLVPKLRFPEFRDAGEWSESILTDICDINPPHDGLPELFYYIGLESVETGMLRNSKRIERKNAPSRAQRYLCDGDIIYQTVRPYQRNNLLFDFGNEDDYVASTGYAQLRARENVEFLYQLIHTDLFVQRVLAKCTGSNYPAINSSDLESVNIWIPPDPAEQQRIADCLSSLDALIAAQAAKLDALRAHKRGLMQQIFPSPEEIET
jgi:type I restriction enzyme S subunit